MEPLCEEGSMLHSLFSSPPPSPVDAKTSRLSSVPGASTSSDPGRGHTKLGDNSSHVKTNHCASISTWTHGRIVRDLPSIRRIDRSIQ